MGIIHFNKGEIVECTNGHKICEIGWTCYKRDVYTTDIFQNFTQSKPSDSDSVEHLSCDKCGASWVVKRFHGLAFNIRGRGWV